MEEREDMQGEDGRIGGLGERERGGGGEDDGMGDCREIIDYPKGSVANNYNFFWTRLHSRGLSEMDNT